jgi:hypothetical protein
MAVDPLKLPRLSKGWDKQPQLLERYWDIQATKLEGVLNQILAIPLIIDALADLDAATQTAQDAADNANAAAESVTSESSLVNSYVANFTPPIISADTSGTVTIANHDRVYGNSVLNPTVSVDGDSVITGQPAGSVVRIYYNDPSRAGGAVTYLFTVDPAEPPVQGGNTHSVGAVEIPAAGSVDGGWVRPPGYAGPIP